MTSSSSVTRVNPSPALTDRDAIHGDRKLTGQLLLDIANDPRFSARHRELDALARAVAAGGSAESLWHGVDLHASFTPESTIRLAPRRLRWVPAFIGALAGIVVFLPVAWTWWSLHRATQAYQQLLAQGPKQEGASFLQLWATGFEGLLPQHLWLSDVAQWAVILIASSVLLIVLERVISRSADRNDEESHRECATRLAQTLSYATITINSGNIEDPIQRLEIVAETIAKLLDAHRRTSDAAAQLTRAASGLEAATSRMTSKLEDSLSTLLEGFNSSIEGTVTSLGDAVQTVTAELLRSAGTISQDFSQSIVSTSDTLEAAATTAAGKLTASADRIAQSSNEMQTAASASTAAQQTLAGAAARIEVNVQSLENALRSQLKELTDAISRETGALRGTTGDFARQVSANTSEVGLSLGQHTSALQHQISELTQIRASIERLLDEKTDGDLPRPLQAAGR
ncbi:MAG: hypothetical protein J0H86_02160 [Xanthomonadaceae bacterium]|nr:hypothetical protein [Xanthomonadaceae bacterium]